MGGSQYLKIEPGKENEVSAMYRSAFGSEFGDGILYEAWCIGFYRAVLAEMPDGAQIVMSIERYEISSLPHLMIYVCKQVDGRDVCISTIMSMTDLHKMVRAAPLYARMALTKLFDVADMRERGIEPEVNVWASGRPIILSNLESITEIEV